MKTDTTFAQRILKILDSNHKWMSASDIAVEIVGRDTLWSEKCDYYPMLVRVGTIIKRLRENGEVRFSRPMISTLRGTRPIYKYASIEWLNGD